MKTLGTINGLWKELLYVLQDTYGLISESSFNPYVFPNRTVTFKKNKKTICTFKIYVDRLNIRLPLSFEIATDLIMTRSSIPKSINQNIDWFGCINCKKCEGQNNIVMVEGVPLCNLSYSNFVTEDSRCLLFDITNKEEVEVVFEIIKKSLS